MKPNAIILKSVRSCLIERKVVSDDVLKATILYLEEVFSHKAQQAHSVFYLFTDSFSATNWY
jgi:hypothetical protein